MCHSFNYTIFSLRFLCISFFYIFIYLFIIIYFFFWVTCNVHRLSIMLYFNIKFVFFFLNVTLRYVMLLILLHSYVVAFFAIRFSLFCFVFIYIIHRVAFILCQFSSLMNVYRSEITTGLFPSASLLGWTTTTITVSAAQQ